MVIAQISDPHISSQNPQNTVGLQRALEHLTRIPTPPDVILITGDCTDNGLEAEYKQFKEIIAATPTALYVIPGNHDQRERMLEAFGTQGREPLEGFMQYVVDGPVRLIALDTHIPGQHGGELCERRLAWLEARLAEAPQQPTLLFMHHPPFKIGLTVFDQIGLANTEALGTLVAAHPQIQRILAGHLHMTLFQQFAGRETITCAATHGSWLPDYSQPNRLAIGLEPPVCMLHIWQPSIGMLSIPSLIGHAEPLVTLHDGNGWV